MKFMRKKWGLKMVKNKKYEIVRVLLEDDIDISCNFSDNLDLIIDFLKNLKEKYSEYLKLEFHPKDSWCQECSGVTDFYLVGERYETDKERDKRLDQKRKLKEEKEKSKKVIEKQEKALLAELKAKYEGGN